MTFADTYFKRDIARHEMRVIRDDGVNRHLRFKRPDTMCMHFDLVTWPGYLCYTGDMGTYVFRRLDDMLQFFRRSPTYRDYGMDLGYWAEKVEAQDREGVKVYSADVFRAAIARRLDDYCEGMLANERQGITLEVASAVLRYADDGEQDAMHAALDFRHDVGRRSVHVFQDFWEVNCKEYAHRFLWCCHALEWAIATYDAAKEQSAVSNKDSR